MWDIFDNYVKVFWELHPKLIITLIIISELHLFAVAGLKCFANNGNAIEKCDDMFFLPILRVFFAWLMIWTIIEIFTLKPYLS
jgi:hypothetical protein